MSLEVTQFIAHRIVLQDEQLRLVPRGESFPLSGAIDALAQQLNHTFNTKPGKGLGGFSQTEGGDEPDFRSRLQQYLDDDAQFVPVTTDMCQMLIKSMVDVGMVEAGFVVFSQYRHLATDYLLIAILTTREHVEIDAQLELNMSQHLDLSKMQLACRIDLTQLGIEPDAHRYISFIKGRAGRKVADFFLTFLGCEEEVDIKQQNQQLMQCVEQYIDSEQLQPEEKQERRKEVATYCNDKLQAGENIEIKELADTLGSADQESDFYAFSQAQEQPLEPEFQADRSALKTLTKFSGQGGGLSVSFDRGLLGERIIYDPATDTLIIKGLPPNLKDQLSRN